MVVDRRLSRAPGPYATAPALDCPITYMRIEDMPYNEAFALFEKETGLVVRFAPNAARTLAETRPLLTTRLRKVKANKVLRTLLEQIPSADVRTEYNYQVSDDGSIVVLHSADLKHVREELWVGDLFWGWQRGQPAGTPVPQEFHSYVTDLIRETIGVGSWHTDSGRGTLRMSDDAGVLTVENTTDVVRQIRSLIEALRYYPPVQVWMEMP